MQNKLKQWVKKYKFKLTVVCCGFLLLFAVVFILHKTTTFYARTSSGIVQGVMVDGVNAFLGIPYAIPPVGKLRWSSPHIPKKWMGVKKTNTVPPHCVQTIFGFTRGQEDCLYLNVWTPTLFPKKPLPVMVWIHGGGFIVGHSYETTPGERLAKRGDVVVVSVNYRLGAFGFMAHPDLTREGKGSSGNYGMEDQIFALQWVRRNIKFFGGDINNVTIFGESAGGMSVCNLLVSPEAKGLFHKAIIESGPCFSPYPDLATMEKQGQTMETMLKCDTAQDRLACMRSKTPKDILAAMPPDPGMAFGEDKANWMPNIDGKVLLEQPMKSLQEGRFEKVPVINGNNANEGNLIVMFGHEYQFKKLTPEKYPDRINYLVRNDEKVKQVLQKYPLQNYADPEEALSVVLGDHSFVCQEKWTSDAIAKYAPVYSYYFSYPKADFVLPEARKLGAFHSAEVQFLFGHSMAWFESTFSGDEMKLSNNMMDYWTQFAKTGNPNGTVDHIWPLYGETKNSNNKMRLQLDTTLGEKSAHETDGTCAFWDQIENKTYIQ